MQKRFTYLWCMLFAFVFSMSLQAQSTASAGGDRVIRVKLQREVAARISENVVPLSNGIVRTGVTPFDNVSSRVKAVRMKRVFPYSPKFEEKHRKYGLDLWYEIRYSDATITPAAARNLYKAVPGVQLAEEVRPVQLIDNGPIRTVTEAELKQTRAVGTLPFNDPLLPKQWHYSNDGSLMGSVVGADVNLFKAWETTTGSRDVLVAIIDGGFQVNHPDLKDNVFINQAELNGQPGVDDDGNGYVDDVYGWNFVINSPDISAHSHGTHVAGTVGATNNNGIGVAGVAGGNGQGGVKMMTLQIFDDRANINADWAAALVYAADMGAAIAQCSWGWNSPGYVEQAVLDAIDYFTAEGGGQSMHGGLCIFAAGNTGDSGDYYPGCYDKTVAVGSMTSSLQPASYSTYGQWVDVTAPGGLMDFGTQFGVLSTTPNDTYGYMEGTSMACPHVSGIAALVLSKYGNPDFSNETLRQQLVSSVNDFYTKNPEATGLFGSGYIDAYKCLQVGTGAAPEAVADFALTPSQDNVLVEWIIPEAEEKSVDHHIIYYSTSPFTAESDLNALKSVNVDTKFQLSGAKMQYELKGLTPLTTYYIAIKSVSRLGVAATLSPVKETRTNAGPQVELSKKALTLNVKKGQSAAPADSLVINNVGEGILKYNLSASTTQVNITTYGHEAKPGRIVPFNGEIVNENVSQYPVVSADFQTKDYPVTMTYARMLGAYVGEGDITLPNAEAQYFYVDPAVYPNGFNLTALNIGGTYGKDPIIEIYDGASSISKASLLQTVDYMFFAYNYDINLKEQLFFKPGSAFWVVVKFAPGYSKPLGAGVMKDGIDVKQYSFYSSDNGATWTQLSEVLRHGNLADIAETLTWDIRAISKNPDWSSVLAPSKLEGVVRPGAKETLGVTNDGQPMVNGTYKFNLYLNTNETAKPKQQIGVTLKVEGYEPVMSSAKVVDFGDLLVGQEKTLTVEIANSGYGLFGGNYGSLGAQNIKCSNANFSVPGYLPAFAARSVGKIDVTFRPTASGSHSGSVTLTDKNGKQHTFIVRGIASMPAELTLDKNAIDFDTLLVGGDEKVETVKITNTGEFPLQYVFPKYSDEVIEGANAHKYGYSYISNLEGSTAFAYDGNPALNGEKDITSQFNSNNWQSEAIGLGFKFPFYGKEYTSVYITSHGSIAMQTVDGNISCMVPTGDCVQGLGYISAYANSGKLTFGANSKISYGRQDGKFTVKFSNVLTPATNGGDEYTPISFHFSLCADGSVECYYDDYQPESVFMYGQGIFVGVSDITCSDPFVVTDVDAAYDGSELFQSIRTGAAIKILAPARSMIKSISDPAGVINIGESRDITITVAAEEGHFAGNLTNHLTLMTNDPKRPAADIELRATIAGENLQPVAVLDCAQIDFGRVFRTSEAVRSVLLSNNGTDSLRVSSVAVKNGKFLVAENVKNAFVVAPGTGKDLLFTLPTETEGAVSDEIVITYADGTTVTLPVSGEVIGTPAIGINPEAITATTPYLTPVSKDLTVTNSGNETLSFYTEPDELITLKNQVADDASSVSYVYRASTDYKDVTLDWIDLKNDPEAAHQDIFYYVDKTDFYTVDLPFEFPFYGKKYTKMYIYNTGFVSFSEHTDYKSFPEPPAKLPDTQTFYSNIIAPFWGNHSMGEGDADGSYYKVEKDRVIVSYVNYGNSMMFGMNFQVILYKDGHYKFQYKLDDTGMMLGTYGLAGIQDETGTRGIDLAKQYIAPGNAIEFYPVMNYNVSAGKSVTIPVEVKADRMAGIYETALKLHTNVPTQPVATVPVQLTIQGEADPVFPETVGGEVVADPVNMPTLTYEFEVKNAGSKAFKITNVDFNSDYSLPAQMAVYATYVDDWFGDIVTGWTMWLPGMEVEVGAEPVKFQIMVYDMGMPMTLDAPITMTLDGLDETEHVVPFHLDFTESPVLTFSKPEIAFESVRADFTGRDTVMIKNTGAYKLDYSLRLDPKGVGETPEEPDMGGGGIAPGVMNVRAAALTDAQRAEVVGGADRIVPNTVFDGYIYDVPPVDCNNLLYYPVTTGTNKALMMGTGEGNLDQNFRAATQFCAPAEGFNLSHLYFAATVGNLENVDIEAYVIGSSDILSENVIGHGTLHIDSEEPVDGKYVGMPRMLKFDRPVYINPADTFYVVLKYPAGYPSSALLCIKDEPRVREGRYMAWLKDYGWIDLGREMQQYGGSFGYFMTCVEKEAGQPWIKLITDETSGTLAPGDSLPVTVEVNAASAYFDKDNRAVLVVKSSDPTQKLVNYPVTLSKNSAPVITLPAGTTTVPEAGTAQFTVSASDAEGNAFTLTVADESGIATLDSCVADGNQLAITDGTVNVPANTEAQLYFTLKADYGQAGNYAVRLTAVDTEGGQSEVLAAYNVEHTNRAPVFTGETEYTVAVGQSTPVIEYAGLFTDPDGDAMTYTVSVPSDKYVSLFTSEIGFVANGRQIGAAMATITATDAAGVSTTQRVKITVTTADAIGTVTADKGLSVWPNPVHTTTAVTLSEAAQGVTYRVYDAAGRTVYTSTAAAKAAGEAQTLDLSALNAGLYHLEVAYGGKTQSVKLLKK